MEGALNACRGGSGSQAAADECPAPGQRKAPLANAARDVSPDPRPPSPLSVALRAARAAIIAETAIRTIAPAVCTITESATITAPRATLAAAAPAVVVR